MGHLVVLSGELSGQEFAVGGSPVSIGSGRACTIQLSQQLDDEELIPNEHSRVWVREGLLMVHEVRRLTVDGSEGGRWQKLASGEQLMIGPYTLRFDLEGVPATVAAAPAPVTSVLRESPDTPPTGTLWPDDKTAATSGETTSPANGGQPTLSEGPSAPASAPEALPDIRRDPPPAEGSAPPFPLKRPTPHSEAQETAESAPAGDAPPAPDAANVPNVLRDHDSTPPAGDDADGQDRNGGAPVEFPQRPQPNA